MMFVGVIIATAIAAAVVVTMGSNLRNKDRTQSFIAAESGRDAAVDALSDGCAASDFSGSGSNPAYSYSVRVSGPSEVTQPASFDAVSGNVCPTSNAWVVVRSTGTGPDGSTTTIDSVYPWIVTWEQQAGGVLAYFANGVSLRGTYAGDIVVRSGNYTCENEGTLDGDLYVTRGRAIFNRDCTVVGDVWSYDDVDGSSQRINITGNVKAGGVTSTGTTVSADVTFTSNGTVIGTETDPETGSIEATGNIDLTNTGSTDGRGWGNLLAGGLISVGDKWSIDPTATRIQSTPPPPFDPTLEFIRAITAWMDLDKSSGWGATSIVACDLTPAQIVATLTTGGTDAVVFDYSSCSSVHTNVTIPSGIHTLNKDAAFILPAGKVANISIAGNLRNDRQIVFMHEDANRSTVAGETQPTCGNGNQRDNFDISAGVTIEPRLMVYTPCGLNGTVNSSFRGQLYSNDTSGVTFIGAASYTCALMEWAPAFEKLGCKVRGEGEDVVIETVLVQRLGERVYQTERAPTPTPTPTPTVP